MGKNPQIPKKLSSDGLLLDYNKFSKELSSAEYALGLLEGSQRKLQNPRLLISPLTAKEATVSSRIEGTQSTVSDVFLYEAGGMPKHSDIRQVINYRVAMQSAIKEIKNGRKFSKHLIKDLHKVLLEDVRHKGSLGKFREGLVWIAEKSGDPIEKAIYIPPEAHLVDDLIDNLMEFIEKGYENALIKAGIVHYQFEAIHPFDDGNGRIGRLLVPLLLFKKQKLSEPILYLSGYFDEHRDEYIDTLHKTDETGQYEDWLSFFFRSVAEQLKITQEIVDKIYNLYNQVKEEHKRSKSHYLIPFVDFLFASPVFTSAQAQRTINCQSRLTTKSLIEFFQKKNFLSELPYKEKRFKLYEFKPLLKILS